MQRRGEASQAEVLQEWEERSFLQGQRPVPLVPSTPRVAKPLVVSPPDTVFKSVAETSCRQPSDRFSVMRSTRLLPASRSSALTYVKVYFEECGNRSTNHSLKTGTSSISIPHKPWGSRTRQRKLLGAGGEWSVGEQPPHTSPFSLAAWDSKPDFIPFRKIKKCDHCCTCMEGTNSCLM